MEVQTSVWREKKGATSRDRRTKGYFGRGGEVPAKGARRHPSRSRVGALTRLGNVFIL